MDKEEAKFESKCEKCIVRKLNSLRAMTKAELKAISKAKTSKKIKKGETIFNEGVMLNGVYCVRNGVSKLSKLSSNGRDQIIRLASKGEVIGKRTVVTDESTNLLATAVTDMEVCFIPKENIDRAIHDNPGFSLEILRHLAHDLKEADDAIVNLGQKNVKQRLAESLLQLKKYGVDENGFLILTLSREDLANVVGTATESLIRILSEFKKLGYLKASGKKLGILDEKKLRELISK